MSRPSRPGQLLVSIALFVAAGLPAQQAAAQAYPSKPIRVIVPYAPGGSSDNVARLLNQKMQESWGQSVLVDYKPVEKSSSQ